LRWVDRLPSTHDASSSVLSARKPDATLIHPGFRAERHHHGIETDNNLSERHVARVIVRERHRITIIDHQRVSPSGIGTQSPDSRDERHGELVEPALGARMAHHDDDSGESERFVLDDEAEPGRIR
jgi:hypothetical protein